MIASGSALVLGITYVIGGLIVNLNLARRGIVEFQILKVKYLVVGLIFLLHMLGAFVMAAIPAFFLLLLENNVFVLQGVNILSMIAAGSLIVIWAKLPMDTTSRFSTWEYWFVASLIGAVFPTLILMRHIFAPKFDVYSIVLIAQAIMTAALTFLSQVYHYSIFYYGHARRGLRTLDPIGIGAPIPVQFGCEESKIKLLKNMGIPVKKSNITERLMLIDETDKHYIVSYLDEENEDEKTLKITKDMVKAILYKPDQNVM
jgi:hypothetical protein